MLISSRMSKRILKNRFSGKDRWSNETLCKVKAGFLMFPSRTRVLFISLKCHTSPYPPPLPLWVWHFSQSLLGILSSGVPPGSQNLDPFSDQCCYNIICRVVTRMDICLVPCHLTLVNWNLPSAVWYLRSSNEKRAFRQRPPRWTQISLVFPYL